MVGETFFVFYSEFTRTQIHSIDFFLLKGKHKPLSMGKHTAPRNLLTMVIAKDVVNSHIGLFANCNSETNLTFQRLF